MRPKRTGNSTNTGSCNGPWALVMAIRAQRVKLFFGFYSTTLFGYIFDVPGYN